MILCERCTNRQNCEYTPYDVECDTKFKDIREDYMDKMCHSLSLENEIVIAFCKMCKMLPQTREANELIRDIFNVHMRKHNENENE